MVRTWWLSLVSAAVLGTAGLLRAAVPDTRAPDQVVADIGLQVAGELAVSHFYEVTKQFDKELTAKMSPGQVEKAWQTAPKQKGMGEFDAVVGVRVRREQEGQRVDVFYRFKNAPGLGVVEIVLDGQQKITFLAFKLPPVEPAWTAPLYANELKITDQEWPVGRAPQVLKGILTRPLATGPFPTLVLVPGYGPMDAEGTSGSVGPNRPMRDIAVGLASHGVAVFRFEKRTLAYPKAFGGLYTVNEESVTDALEAVNVLSDMMIIDKSRIMLGGMGSSAALLPRIAQRDRRIRGVVIMSGYSRALSAVLESQAAFLAAVGGPLNKPGQALRDMAAKAAREINDPALKKDAMVKLTDEKVHADIAGSYLMGTGAVSIPGSYWLDLRDYQPAQAAASLNIPILVITAGKDYLAPQADTEGWQGALKDKPGVTFKAFPLLNHYFIAQEGPLSPTEYLVAGHVDQPVIDTLADWVRRPPVAAAP